VWSFPVPEHVWYLEDWPRRVRAELRGETVLDSRRGKLLHTAGGFPAHWFPIADVRTDLLSPGIARTGAAEPGGPPLEGFVTIDYGAIDRWFEEDEPIYAHPRDPYHRVDVRASSVHVVVTCDGTVIAESSRPKLLFETGNPIRYYVPFRDVRIDLLQRSDYVSECPYKGDGQHWHLIVGSQRVDDAAWSLPHPLPEGFAAAEHVCFYPSKVDVEVDGHLLVEPPFP
jgi:uncharacterized protein (DUF427 family)